MKLPFVSRSRFDQLQQELVDMTNKADRLEGAMEIHARDTISRELHLEVRASLEMQLSMMQEQYDQMKSLLETQLADLRERNTQLDRERHRMIDHVERFSTGRPVFEIEPEKPKAAPTEAGAPPLNETSSQRHKRLVREAISKGHNSATAIAVYITKANERDEADRLAQEAADSFAGSDTEAEVPRDFEEAVAEGRRAAQVYSEVSV